jgi:serine/threonine protein kinase
LRQPAPVHAFEREAACQKVTQMVQSLGQKQDESERTIETAGTTFQPRSSLTEYEPLAHLGAYELLAKLGEGGMGAVYKARHVKLDKIVAIKVLPTERMKDKQAVTRFEREMRAVGKLEHPHIVRAMDAGEAEGVHYCTTWQWNTCRESIFRSSSRNAIRSPSPMPAN